MRIINQIIKISGLNEKTPIIGCESIPFNLNVEFECKTDFTFSKPDMVAKLILKRIKIGNIKIDNIDYRKEYHHFYSKKNCGVHRAFIFVNSSKEVWIKEKSSKKIIYTPKYKIPVLVRKERKLKPTDSIYEDIFLDTLTWKYEGSFKKECTDISFWYKNNCFTITFAEADNFISKFSQIELEHDGYSPIIKKPTKKLLLTLFDEVAHLIIPKTSTAFTTKTKLEWLKNIVLNNKHNI